MKMYKLNVLPNDLNILVSNSGLSTLNMKTVVILFLVTIAGTHGGGGGVQKLFEMTKWENCPVKKMIEIFVTVNQTVIVPNKIYYSGHLNVSEKVGVIF
jgi:hypothetical protein